MSKARGLADLGNAFDDGALSNRNLIINGAMQVAQRGTSFTANGYGLDRWGFYNTGGTVTVTQETFASGDSPEVGITNFARVVRASPSGLCYFYQKVEDVRKSDGATLTFSFYGKASSSTTVPFRIVQAFGSGGSSGVDSTPQNINLTSSWQKFSVTFNMASLSGKTIGTGSYLETVFDIPSTTATIDITGVQLEVGDTATPFEHRSYGDELARCQRYYYQTALTSDFFETGGGSVAALTTGDITFWGAFPVEMRAAPSFTAYDRAGNVGKCSRLYNGVAWYDNQAVSTVSWSKGYYYASASGSNANSASIHYKADAEL